MSEVAHAVLDHMATEVVALQQETSKHPPTHAVTEETPERKPLYLPSPAILIPVTAHGGAIETL